MAGSEIAQQVLGQSEDVIHTTSFSELELATDTLVAQARRSVCILSHDSEPELYDREAFAALLARLISQRSQVARIRVLFADTRRAEREGHRLVKLWHRFPSFVDIRLLGEEYARQPEDFLLVDDIGLIRRPHHGEPDAVITFRNIATARERAAWFDEAWTRSGPCTALRRIHL